MSDEERRGAVMGQPIVRIGDLYCSWSDPADAPITLLVDRVAAAAEWGEDRVVRAEQNGHSLRDYGPDHEYWLYNRAGPGETCLNLQGLLGVYASEEAYERYKERVPPEWMAVIDHGAYSAESVEQEVAEKVEKLCRATGLPASRMVVERKGACAFVIRIALTGGDGGGAPVIAFDRSDQ